ncbi:MAG: trigger factor [Muribaculaceae bacterium]|nr:trigger factor [Muribaculaceae bacterium]
MQVTLEKTGDLEGRIKVEVTQNDYLDKVNKELKEIGRTRVIPGFRKGHVSIDQLRRRFGKEVKSHVLNEEVYRAVIEFIRNEKLEVLGEPLPVEVKEINLDDNDYTFEYEIGFAPEINVTLDKEVSMPFYTIEVSDQMANDQDTALRERFGAQVPGEEVDAKALVKGAIMELNADGTVKTEEDAIQVVDGIVAPMYFTDKDQAALFLGKKVGDKVVFNPSATCNGNAAELASMLHIEKEKAADVKGDFEMAISEIIVLKPAEHGEEFYKEVFPGATFTTEEEYFAELRKMIATQLAPNSDHLFSRDAQKLLMEKFGNFELPAAFLKKWLVARNEGLTPENVDEEYAKMEQSIKWELLRGKIAENLDVKVTDEDMLGFAKSIAFQQFAQYGMTNMDDETLTNYAKRILEDRNYAGRIREDVANGKLFNAIKGQISLEAKTVSLDEFKNLAQAK